MKKKICSLILIICALLIVFPACGMSADSSLKSLTKPYITEYECIDAHLGKDDLLKKYDYIKICLLNEREMQVVMKPSNGKMSAHKGTYTYDEQTHALAGEAGILGFKFKVAVILENGKFTITKNFLGLPLIMKFKAK